MTKSTNNDQIRIEGDSNNERSSSEESGNEEMNESMDYIPHTALLSQVSGHQGRSDDGLGGDIPQLDTSPTARRPTLPKRDSTYKNRRFPQYWKSRENSSIDNLQTFSPSARSEQEIHRKIESLGKLLDERTYQKAESNAHYQQILESMSKQLVVRYLPVR